MRSRLRADIADPRRASLWWSVGTGLLTAAVVAIEVGYATRSWYQTSLIAAGCCGVLGLTHLERGQASGTSLPTRRAALDLGFVGLGIGFATAGVATRHPTLCVLAVLPLTAGAASLALAWCLARRG